MRSLLDTLPARAVATGPCAGRVAARRARRGAAPEPVPARVRWRRSRWAAQAPRARAARDPGRRPPSGGVGGCRQASSGGHPCAGDRELVAISRALRRCAEMHPTLCLARGPPGGAAWPSSMPPRLWVGQDWAAAGSRSGVAAHPPLAPGVYSRAKRARGAGGRGRGRERERERTREGEDERERTRETTLLGHIGGLQSARARSEQHGAVKPGPLHLVRAHHHSTTQTLRGTCPKRLCTRCCRKSTTV